MAKYTNKAWVQGKPGGTGPLTTVYTNSVDVDIVSALFSGVKTSSVSSINSGGTVTFTMAITNTSGVAQPNWVFTDPLELGATLVPGSFTVDGVVTTPVMSGAYITHIIPTWEPGVTHTFTFQATLVQVL